MKFRLNIFISSCIFFGLVLLFSTCNTNNTNIQKSSKKLIKPVKDVVKFKKIQGFSLENFKVDSNSVKNGYSFSEILQSLNVPYNKIYSLGNDFKEIYDLRKIYQGDKYYTIFNLDSNKFSNLIYQHSLTEKVVMSFLDSLNIIIIKSPIEIRIQKASGTITSSLWQSFIDNKLSPALVSKVASLYAWTIDFFDIQSGDNYKIIFESKYVENKFIGVGDIKAC